jgi:hypothetical protein
VVIQWKVTSDCLNQLGTVVLGGFEIWGNYERSVVVYSAGFNIAISHNRQ